MDDFVDIAAVGELAIGQAKTIVVGDRKIALCRSADGLFALDNTCPHRGGPLGEGDVVGHEIVCPWHLWSFDLKSGVCAHDRRVVAMTHEIRVEGDRVLVRLAPAREPVAKLL